MALKSKIRAFGLDVDGAYTRIIPEYQHLNGKVQFIVRTWATTDASKKIMNDGRWDGATTEAAISAFSVQTDDPEVVDLMDKLMKKLYGVVKREHIKESEDV